MQKTIKLYETPDMKVFKMHAEGVLCGSVDGNFNPNDLTNGQSGWFEDEE